MAAVNVEVADPLPMSADVAKRMPLSQLVRQKEETEAEIESLCNLMYQLNKTRTKFESTVEIVNKLNSSMDGVGAMIPLTNHMYVQGDISHNNKIVVSLGGEYQVEVDKETAINHFFRKLQRVKSKIGLTQKMLASKMLDAERLKKAAAEKYLEEKTKADAKPLPKYLTG